MARKFFGKGFRVDQIMIVGIIIALVVIGLFLWGPLRRTRTAEEKKGPHQQARTETASPGKQDKPGKRSEEPKKRAESLVLGPSGRAVLVAIVIDDLGQDLKQAREIAALPARITFAVLPGLPQSSRVAELARQKSSDVLVHMPMEYRGRNGKPSPGMLRSDMTPGAFLTTVSGNLESVPGAVGINNHEGSVLTENREAMKFLMAELKARNLLFLDSLTSAKSIAYETAREFGVKTAKRDVFLDNDGDNPASIRKQLDELAEHARIHGRAIGIGHPHPATISELRKWIAETDKLGIEIVPVSKLMN